MKRHSAPAIVKITVFAALLIFLSSIFVAAALGQTPSKTLAPEEQELLKARRANEEAQAEYYREQTNKLRQPPPAASPTPGKTFRQSVAENPASVVGVGGTILGAIIVALVSLTTLYFNSRNAIKAQKDSQFYEAMKRMGDKDSPTLRASAAGLLALMAQHEWREPTLSKKWPFFKLERSKPYFTTAVDQLLTGLLLETNFAVIESLKDALQHLILRDPDTIIRRLHTVNVNLQDALASHIAEFFVISNCQTPPNLEDPKQSSELWSQLEYLSRGYSRFALMALLSKSESFRSRFENYLFIFNNQTAGDRGQILSAIHDDLRIASGRLRANVTLFCDALQRLHPQDIPLPPDWPPNCYLFYFNRLFLVGGSIKPGADLSNIAFHQSNFNGIRLEEANLENTSFWETYLWVHMEGGNLHKSDLSHARLQNAWLIDVDMSDARLGSATIGSGTSFRGCNWWKANFYVSVDDPEVLGPEIDSALLEKLFASYGKYVPTDLDEVHDSVRTFLESRQAKSTPEPSA